MDWQQVLAWAVTFSVVAFVASLALIPLLVVRIPADYFVARQRPTTTPWRSTYPILSLLVLIGKNLVGALLLLAGLVMLFTPGQGLLSLAAGLLLLDFPGKRTFERRLIGHPSVLRAINAVRARAGRAPLEAPRDNDHLGEQPPGEETPR